MYIYLQYFKDLVIPRVYEIFSTLWVKPSILWAVAPLFITALLIEIYFGRHRTEELGWNTAFANTISLFWVSANLIRHLVENYKIVDILTQNYLWLRFTIVGLVALWAIILTLFNFSHMVHKRISFILSSSKILMSAEILVTILILGNITLDIITLIATLILFLGFVILFIIIEHLITPSTGAKIAIKLHKRHVDQVKQEKKELRHQKIREKINKIKEFFKIKQD